MFFIVKNQETEMKKLTTAALIMFVLFLLVSCESTVNGDEETLVYGSGDYTRINPAMDEHGEINSLLFDGLTARDGDNRTVPGLAEDWDYDEETYTYTFYLRKNVRWHDGEPFTAGDVRFLSLIHI